MNKYIISDIETDGLLDTVSKFHCAWTYDKDTEEWTPFVQNLNDYVEFLNSKVLDGYKIVFHNGIKYDIPALSKLTNKDLISDWRDSCLDTLVLARLIYANIGDTDNRLMRSGRLPGKLFGSHSLKAYGYRLGVLKGTYGEQENAWDAYSPEMLEYCKQDIEVTRLLFDKLLNKGYPETAIQLEHDIAWLMAKQERNGFPFDSEKAVKLYAVLAEKRQELEEKLVKTFGSWYSSKGEFTPKKDNKRMGYVAGCPMTKIELVTFNPSSRTHIARCLQLLGWKPTEMTPTGQPKVDETTLENLEFPEGKLVAEYLMLTKRIGQLAEGDMAWLKMVGSDGRMHGSVNPNGAVTGRATHSFPNVAQVPSCGSPYGPECRELFRAPEGWLQVGVDASGLELRCLAHFMYPYDNGAYGHEILNGDIHTANQLAAGLPTRNNAKTFIYGYLYGAGDAKIGEIVNGTAADGKRLKAQFLKKTPALAKLKKAIETTLIEEAYWEGDTQKVVWKKRYHRDNNKLDITRCLIGLDGRPLHIRSPHAALNTLLQSAGALICKKWVCLVEQNLIRAGYKHGWDGDFAFMAWVHDEAQIACKSKDIAENVLRIAQDSMREAQEFFNFKCQLDTDGKIGENWKECH